ncbi:UDP-galactopyranose mutase [Paenibacillus pedocola]|uniref:UDP-galactopyranose mutase n=1 Tax=Paenibacillus pedocola TaxID=3242193 RepID=UPI0028779858|nr:UDP-galactopyranose mutase [Paenibacillus typhae]
MFDYIIVGSGFAGSVIAERIANQLQKRVLIIEKRQHIAGNAFDSYNEAGILVHNYGPHIFHTKIKEVWDYLSQFTDWNIYHHQVLGVIDGVKVPIPFNINSLYEVFPKSIASKLEEKLIQSFGYNVKVPILKLKETEDEDLKYLADFVYEKVFLNYTLKQWGLQPEDLDASVTGRVPVYISRDNRYFQDRYQGTPKFGYTKMFERILDNENIKVLTNTDYKEIVDINTNTSEIKFMNNKFDGQLIYTGPIDYFFDYKYGELPYRSINFKFNDIHQASYQQVGTVNYPNDYDFTRITEFKHLTGQRNESTSIVKEFSEAYIPGVNVPYYPIKNDSNFDNLKNYKTLVRQLDNVHFIGRLAEYQYYDMDAVIAKALRVFNEKILKSGE